MLSQSERSRITELARKQATNDSLSGQERVQFISDKAMQI
jgi:hypothetical protein